MSSPRHHKADVVLRDGSTVHVAPGQDRGRARSPWLLRAPAAGVDRPVVLLRLPGLDRAVRWATEVDDQHRYGLVATSGADGRVVTHAGWEREPDRPGRAEVAFAIANAMQHNGLGTILLGQLIEAATQAGVAVLSAEVLPQNHRMLHVFATAASRSRPAHSRAWSWSSYQHRERRRRWSASNHATAYQATANDAPAVFRCLGRDLLVYLSSRVGRPQFPMAFCVRRLNPSQRGGGRHT